ncbi:hypothetical protein JJC03_09305 [Flavobacterium oreochromis]|uniref:hypothetical protein n=1 Tax=Flavobacterium oreochromis TaxID=2906078 RepID=UPI001CE53ECB|nr:hypothetical protein [Flavobacterium oreochromis]QYS85434.1 hypothetical protein JJC03_09305 [Flavobacterium oreochromis]
MSNTLKIQIPAGFEIDNFDPKTGEVKFKETPKDIKERIKTFVDVLIVLNIDGSAFAEQTQNLPSDELAYKQLKLIAQALNQGWTPDWSNKMEYKYYPWFEIGSPSGGGFSFGGYDLWYSVSLVGSRLCFKSSELAEYAGKQFEAIYKDFLTLNK